MFQSNLTSAEAQLIDSSLARERLLLAEQTENRRLHEQQAVAQYPVQYDNAATYHQEAFAGGVRDSTSETGQYGVAAATIHQYEQSSLGLAQEAAAVNTATLYEYSTTTAAPYDTGTAPYDTGTAPTAAPLPDPYSGVATSTTLADYNPTATSPTEIAEAPKALPPTALTYDPHGYQFQTYGEVGVPPPSFDGRVYQQPTSVSGPPPAASYGEAAATGVPPPAAVYNPYGAPPSHTLESWNSELNGSISLQTVSIYN